MLNCFGDVGCYCVKFVEMLVMVIYFLCGILFIYMGEEFGMIDLDYDNMVDYVDIEVLNVYWVLICSGYSYYDVFMIVKIKVCDNLWMLM